MFVSEDNKGRKKERNGNDVMWGQVWCPILRICVLHLTRPSAHTHTHTQQRVVNTHTHREHTTGAEGSNLCCGARGAVGGSVPCSRVSTQSWYWGWRERWSFTPPHPQSLLLPRLEPATSPNKSIFRLFLNLLIFFLHLQSYMSWVCRQQCSPHYSILFMIFLF